MIDFFSILDLVSSDCSEDRIWTSHNENFIEDIKQ